MYIQVYKQMKSNCQKLEKHFQGCLYFSAGKLYRSVERMATEVFGELSLAPSHAFLLMALEQAPHKTCTSSELASFRQQAWRLARRQVKERRLSGRPAGDGEGA